MTYFGGRTGVIFRRRRSARSRRNDATHSGRERGARESPRHYRRFRRRRQRAAERESHAEWGGGVNDCQAKTGRKASMAHQQAGANTSRIRVINLECSAFAMRSLNTRLAQQTYLPEISCVRQVRADVRDDARCAMHRHCRERSIANRPIRLRNEAAASCEPGSPSPVKSVEPARSAPSCDARGVTRPSP